MKANILDYFDPVSLNKPQYSEYFIHRESFGQRIDIHTPDNLPSNKYDIALIGLTENRGCFDENISLSADLIRGQLYMLNFFEKNLKIVDLGNLKSGNTLTDTYYGIRDVVLDLLADNTIPIFFGSSQDLTCGIFMAFESLKNNYYLTTVDYRLDFNFDDVQNINFINYLNYIVLNQKYLFEYTNIGHQQCFENFPHSDLMENLFYENIRLGLLRNNIFRAEPRLRDSNIISIDMSSIKHADAVGQLIASPNGFSAEEICQIAHYSGISDSTQVFGLFNYLPLNDLNCATAALSAQIIWYFIDGFSFRLNENPQKDISLFQQYFVTLNDEHHLKFYKSKISQRWWVEVPSKDQNVCIACSEDDYYLSLKNEIPDHWIKVFKKLN
jgi:arginase family enzyme